MSDPTVHNVAFEANPVQKEFILSTLPKVWWAAQPGEGKTAAFAWLAFQATRRAPTPIKILVSGKDPAGQAKAFLGWFQDGVMGSWDAEASVFTWSPVLKMVGDVTFLPPHALPLGAFDVVCWEGPNPPLEILTALLAPDGRLRVAGPGPAAAEFVELKADEHENLAHLPADWVARRKAHDDLMSYARYIQIPGVPERPVTLAAHHKVILTALQQVEAGTAKRVMLFLPPGSAKALALDTPIPTPSGWKNMGELRVGDQVFDDTGAPCRVTWVSPVWKDRPVYRVKTDCGDVIVADRDHEWPVILDRKPRQPLKNNGMGAPALPDRDDMRSKVKIKETHQLARRRAKRPMILRAGALSLPPADLPVDPYVLGLWLGDGNSSAPCLTIGKQDQPWMLEELRRRGVEVSTRSSDLLFGLLGLRGEFVELGLIHDPAHKTYGRKHIPAIYMRASAEQRLALLQGLVDTDGTVSPKQGCTTFCNTNKELAEGVRELVRSLGVKAGWIEGRATLYGKDCGPAYRVSFYLKDSALLPRKRALTRNQYRTPHTYLEAVEAGTADTVCIEVDSPSHLFLCGRSMTPTHNSTYTSVVFTTWFMGRNPGADIISVSYASDLAQKFGRYCRTIVRSPEFKSVFGTELSDESTASDRWALLNGANYRAFGMLSGITGNRADGVLIDDPVRGREDADSLLMRNKTWDAYLSDVRTRLKPHAWIAVIQCMTGDTPVTMEDGSYKRLDAIQPGDRIWAWKDGLPVVRSVLRWSDQGDDDILELRTGNSRVRANARHPFLVQTETGAVWRRLGDIKPGDRLVSSRFLPQGRSSPSMLTEDEAWLLGYMFGDGWVTVRDTTQKSRGQYTTKSGEKRVYAESSVARRGYVTCVALSAKQEENDYVASMFESIFGLVPKKTRFGYRRTEVADVGRWFLARGLTGKAKTKRIPSFLYSEPAPVRESFIRGYLAADGAVISKGKAAGRWTFGSCNVDLIRDVRHLLRGLGYSPTNISTYRAKIKAPNSPKAVDAVNVNVQTNPHSRVFNPFVLETVRSVSPVGRERVYDIQVEDAECFFADGLVSHNTRWHEDDLSGRILPENYAGESGWVTARDGEQWFVINIPAQAEREDDPLQRKPGEWLWPEWWPVERWEQERKTQMAKGTRNWASLYQQRPTPEEGDYFQRSWIKFYDAAPALETLRIYGASDYAVTEQGGDYTVHGVVGVDPDDNIYVLDWWRGQKSSDVWVEAFLGLCQKWKPVEWAEEAGQINKSVGPFITKQQRERSIYTYRRQYASTKDKPSRAQAIRARMAMGKVLLPRTEWAERLVSELLTFPAGKNDDQVDVMSLIGRILDRMIPGKAVLKPAPPKMTTMADVTLDMLWKDAGVDRESGFIR